MTRIAAWTEWRRSMSSEVEMLDRDGLLEEYVEEMADMVHGCLEYDVDAFYDRISEDLVSKGAYLSQEDDIELVMLLMKKSKVLNARMLEKNRQKILHAFADVGVDVTLG